MKRILTSLPILLFLVFSANAFAETANNIPKKHNTSKHAVEKVTYKNHVKTAAAHGITPIATSKQLNKYVAKKKLAAAKCTNKGCTIARLTHSEAYLVPKANKVMNEISKAFYTKTKSSFTVTSITRTLADQHRLRQVNANATHGLSAHNFGASYDISYIRFNGKKAPNPKLERALENVLIQFQKEGKIYYIKEKWQSCFHVTVKG